jgi:hypothetical protein
MNTYTQNETFDGTVARPTPSGDIEMVSPVEPGGVPSGPGGRSGDDAALFVYYVNKEGYLQQRKQYRNVILRVIQPWRDKRFTYDHVDFVFDEAAEKLRKAYVAGKLKHGLTATIATLIFERTAVDFVRNHGRGPGTESLSAPLQPRPSEDSGGAAASR